MQKRPSEQGRVSTKDAASDEPEVDYRPRTYSAKEQLSFAAKCTSIVGVLVLVLWLLDRYT